MAMASSIRGPCSQLVSRDDIAAMALVRHGKTSPQHHSVPACVLDHDHRRSCSRSASFPNRSELLASNNLSRELSLVCGTNAALPLRKKSGTSMAHGCRCLGEGAWFELPPESSSTNAQTSTVGDFKILSHLQQLGCGELTKKPQEVHFPGCMNESYAFHCTGGNYFVKINRRFDVDTMFAGELEALERMKATNTIRVPTPFGCGSLADGGSYLIMEHLHFRPFGMLQNSCQEALGRSMAQLHLADVGPAFGFPLQTRLGVHQLSNSWSTSWSEFFIEKRLRERLQSAYAVFEEQVDLRKKGDLVLEHAALLLKGYHPRPSLLHGDLWMGNSGLLSSGEVAIYDPASFIGDSEFGAIDAVSTSAKKFHPRKQTVQFKSLCVRFHDASRPSGIIWHFKSGLHQRVFLAYVMFTQKEEMKKGWSCLTPLEPEWAMHIEASIETNSASPSLSTKRIPHVGLLILSSALMGRTYHELLPRAAGFEERHKVYQLYHLLNHLLIYRVEYFQPVITAMDKILAC